MLGGPTDGEFNITGGNDFGLADSMRRARNPMNRMANGNPRPVRSPMGAMSQMPQGLARQGVTGWTPGMGNPHNFAPAAAAPTPAAPIAPGVPAAPVLPPQAQAAMPELPPQAMNRGNSPFTKPMFSFLFGGQ